MHYTAKIDTVYLQLPMNEHPVPRNVTGFQFQLIGFMTLKQFGYLAAGAIMAVIFWNAGVLSFFRFPIAAVLLFIGAAFAFFPIQERPLDVWVVNLIRTVYMPTQFVWQKELQIPEALTHETKAMMAENAAPPEHREDTKSKLAAYLASIQPREEERLDSAQNEKVRNVSGLLDKQSKLPFIPITVPQPKAAPQQHTTPTLPKGTIKGMVEIHNKALPGMLIHILNSQGQQMRLLKSSADGTFTTTIPLEEGEYRLTPEDPNGRYLFRPFSFTIGLVGLHPWLIVPTGEKH